MNILKNISAAAIAICFCACANAQSGAYTVTIPLSSDEDGLEGYILDYDTGQKIDSAMVSDSRLVFNGSVDKPVMVQLIIDGTRQGMFILEPGNISGDISTRAFTGTPLTEKLISFGKKVGEFQHRFQQLPRDSAGLADASKIETEYQEFVNSQMKENINNPLGFYLFLQDAYEMDLASLDTALKQNPQFASSTRIAKLRDNLVKKDATSVGKKFKDFTIVQPDGTKKSLSDHVGRGHYTLVDFWASWCGPCIRATKDIKTLYNKYSDKGLEVLGVAVWDKTEDTLQGIKQHDLPWEQIINAQSIPTDIYGISGIPCIILFDPEGNIVSRDKQGADLINDVTKAMESLPKE